MNKKEVDLDFSLQAVPRQIETVFGECWLLCWDIHSSRQACYLAGR